MFDQDLGRLRESLTELAKSFAPGSPGDKVAQQAFQRLGALKASHERELHDVQMEVKYGKVAA